MSASHERNLRSAVNRPSEREESNSSRTGDPSASTQLAQDIATATVSRDTETGLERSRTDAGEEQGVFVDETESDIGSEGGQQETVDSDEEFESLKRQASRKRRDREKQALRRYLSEDDPDLSIIVQGEQYGNPENLNQRKRKQRATSNGGGSDSEDNANLLRIRPNPPPSYGATNEQEWRTFVNALEAYWDGWPKRVRTAHKIAISSTYFKGLAATDWAETRSKGRTPATWEAYIEYLHNFVADPANRMVTVYEKLKEIK